MAFLKLRQENTTFEYVVPETDGQVVLTLRIVPDDEQKRIRKAHTRSHTDRHGTREIQDTAKIADDLTDAAIVRWVGVCDATTEEPLPCTRAYKLLLPMSLQREVVRQAVARESDAEELEAAKNG